jgi:hypothetical protein
LPWHSFLLTLILGNLPVAIGLLVVAAIALIVTSGYLVTLKAAGVMAVAAGIAFLTGNYLLDLEVVLIIVLSVFLAGIVYAWYIYRQKMKSQAIIYASCWEVFCTSLRLTTPSIMCSSLISRQESI